jgi:hypothetical protein
VWSDEDPDFEWTDQITEHTDQLRELFGAFIDDPVSGGWWT